MEMFTRISLPHGKVTNILDVIYMSLSFVLFNDMVSVRTFGVMYDHTLFYATHHQIKHQATRNVDCQPGDC